MVITPVIVTSRNPEKQGSSIVKLNAGRIHERSKKAGVHTVQYVPQLVISDYSKLTLYSKGWGANKDEILSCFYSAFRSLVGCVYISVSSTRHVNIVMVSAPFLTMLSSSPSS
jgi:hypothetical protein